MPDATRYPPMSAFEQASYEAWGSPTLDEVWALRQPLPGPPAYARGLDGRTARRVNALWRKRQQEQLDALDAMLRAAQDREAARG